MSKVIFRVQDNLGRGPWKPGFSHLWVEDRPDLENLKPWFFEFHGIKLLYGLNYGSGCLTEDALRRWFTPIEYSRLIALGYHAVTLEADGIIARSIIQCVFYKIRPLFENVKEISLYDPAPAARQKGKHYGHD